MTVPSKTKKIAHVYWDLKIGGIQTIIGLLAEHQSVNYHVTVIIMAEDKASIIEKFNSNVEVIFLNKKEKSRISAIISVLKLNKLLLTHHYDLIHFHDPAMIRFVFPFVKGLFVGTYHRDKRFYPTKRFAKTTAVSKHVASELAQNGFSNVVVIENSINVEKYRKKESYSNDKLKIVQVGRLLHEVKAQDVVIKALAELTSEKINFSLDFIGIGPSFDYLKRMTIDLGLSEHVNFLGLKDQNYLFENLSTYDLLIQPSNYEAFGLTILEGMAAGVPVLVSQIDSQMQIIEFGKYGDFFKVGDVESLKNKIKEIVKHGYSEERITKAKEFVKKNYSPELMNKKYLSLYESLI